jgi:molybdopterin-guanine dinucleotide biosynthesis protein MobB
VLTAAAVEREMTASDGEGGRSAVAQSRIVSVIGRKHTGKTSLVVALAGEFTRRGYRVMTIKHATHSVDADQPGTDSYRHFHEGKSERTLLVAPNVLVSFERHAGDPDPIALAAHYCQGADIVLAEGFHWSALPKIEVIRLASDKPHFDAALASASDWIAIVTDHDDFQAQCPVFRFGSTTWLSQLADLTWTGAAIVSAA